METPKPTKRLYENPNSFPNVPNFNQNEVDLTISSFFSLSDSPLLSSPFSIGCSFDRAIEKLFEASGDDDPSQDRLVDRGLELVSLLHESTKKYYRKRTTLRNSRSWSLPHVLTVKVFSMLDTKSLIRASASCTMFNECAKDPLCYSHIDLTTVYIDDKVVHSMINHAGKELRSLKVGCVLRPDQSLLTRSCLAPLSFNGGFSGNLLESLHIYCHKWLDNNSLRDALSACSNLTDLKIVGWNISPRDEVLESLSRKCEHLFIESAFKSGSLRYGYVKTSFWRNCPDLTSLSLIRFALNDGEVSYLIKSFRKLKYLNLSKTFGIEGRFLSIGCKDTLLETLILRDCHSLEKEHIFLFLDSLLKGHFRFIQQIEVSNQLRLLFGNESCSKLKFYLEKLKQERPDLTFVTGFASPPSSLGDTSSVG